MKQFAENLVPSKTPSNPDALLGCTFHLWDGVQLVSWWSSHGLTRLSWSAHLTPEELPTTEQYSPLAGAKLSEALQEYARGNFEPMAQIPVDLRKLPPFSRLVLETCRLIAPGKVKTYGQLAAEVDAPNASRGVGQAMARNPIPIVIPCHRVVGSTGSMTGYSGLGGLDTKRRLLRWEHAAMSGYAGRLETFPQYALERLAEPAVH